MTLKKPAKDERERLVLLGLVELYLETGKPVGSSTLREHGFQNLSSATIRNYFAKLEKGGFLKQQHSSGGRIPTEGAYKLYVETLKPQIKEKDAEGLRKKKGFLNLSFARSYRVLSFAPRGNFPLPDQPRAARAFE